MQNKKIITILLFAVLSIFMITACSNNSGSPVLPEPELKTVKKFYSHNNSDLRYSQYAILDEGSLYVWGDNSQGQLGIGSDDEYVEYKNKKKVYLPDKVNRLWWLEYNSKYGDKFLTYAILEDGSLYVWGKGYGYSPNNVYLPGKIKELRNLYNYYSNVSMYAILEDGSLYAWGGNDDGQLGVGDNIEKNEPTKVNLPGKIKELKNYDNIRSTYAILEDGSLYTWGYNNYGQLGVGDEVDKNAPTKVNLPGKIKELMIVDDKSAYAILEEGSLYAWGNNGFGLLGVGDEVDKNAPTKVNLPGKIKELRTSNSGYGSDSMMYAILEDGSLYAWGYNRFGQLGVGDEVNKNAPTKVNLSGKIKELISSGSSIYAILEDGSLYAWGGNDDGQLGVGDEVNKNAPTKVNLSGKIKELISSGSSIYAILEDGSLYVWGDNNQGQLGVGDEVYRYTPIKANMPGKINQLFTRVIGKKIYLYSNIYMHSNYATTEDGSLYAWGYNHEGQLGIGSAIGAITEPTLFTGIPGIIKQIESSDRDTYFLTNDGLLYGAGLQFSNYPEQIEFKDK